MRCLSMVQIDCKTQASILLIIQFINSLVAKSANLLEHFLKIGIKLIWEEKTRENYPSFFIDCCIHTVLVTSQNHFLHCTYQVLFADSYPSTEWKISPWSLNVLISFWLNISCNFCFPFCSPRHSRTKT